MISQADIIRTLVNQNCTDETIMSTALSPNCTPPKLLEQFAEAERFDLALDVSMKLGWDALPIWKTWAMRCLASRNFPEARKKFRRCFQMVRTQDARASLLKDILRVLTKMKEQKLTLADEVDMIKRGKRSRELHGAIKRQSLTMDQDRPKIFNECMSYLREYGNNPLKIRFYIENHLWDRAVEILLDDSKLTLFFINDVVPHSVRTGNLDRLVSTMMKQDPKFERLDRYFSALYAYCMSRMWHNTLYFIQKEFGDHVAASLNLVTNFFLKPPTVDYKELYHRLAHLSESLECIKQYLAEQDQHLVRPYFFAKLERDEAERRLRMIGLQLDITRNFAINEVSGCINGIKVVHDEKDSKTSEEDSDNSPVTVFDLGARRRTFLAALVLSYYDENFDTCFSQSGFDSADRLIEEFGLDKLQVFRTALRVIIEDESLNIVETANLLLKRLRDDYLACTRRMRKAKKNRSNLVELTLDSLKISSKESDEVIARPLKPAKARRNSCRPAATPPQSEDSPESNLAEESSSAYSFVPKDKNVQPGSSRAARLLCDELIRDAVISCPEPDYRVELSKLLSNEARIELNIELGKLSVAQRLAFDLNRRDYVMLIVKEADRLKQDHIKELCQKWLSNN